MDRDYMRPPTRRRGSLGGVWVLLSAAGVVSIALWAAAQPPGWLRTQIQRVPAARLPTTAVPVQLVDDSRPPAPIAQSPQASPMPMPPRRPAATAEQPGRLNAEPGTIYRCKSYSGGMFWSQTHCSQHRALIDRIASVPVGLPFDEQARLAEGEARAIEQSIKREQANAARDTLCIALQHERDTIWRRSGSGGGYVALDQLGADQARWRQIDQLMNANGCRRR